MKKCYNKIEYTFKITKSLHYRHGTEFVAILLTGKKVDSAVSLKYSLESAGFNGKKDVLKNGPNDRRKM